MNLIKYKILIRLSLIPFGGIVAFFGVVINLFRTKISSIEIMLYVLLPVGVALVGYIYIVDIWLLPLINVIEQDVVRYLLIILVYCVYIYIKVLLLVVIHRIVIRKHVDEGVFSRFVDENKREIGEK